MYLTSFSLGDGKVGSTGRFSYYHMHAF